MFNYILLKLTLRNETLVPVVGVHCAAVFSALFGCLWQKADLLFGAASKLLFDSLVFVVTKLFLFHSLNGSKTASKIVSP